MLLGHGTGLLHTDHCILIDDLMWLLKANDYGPATFLPEIFHEYRADV